MHQDILEKILQLIVDNGLVAESGVIPLNRTITDVQQFSVRAAINYGIRMDKTCLRKSEDFIITLQFFTLPNQQYQLNDKLQKIRQIIQKSFDCCPIDNTIYTLLSTEVVTSGISNTMCSTNINLMFNALQCYQ